MYVITFKSGRFAFSQGGDGEARKALVLVMTSLVPWRRVSDDIGFFFVVGVVSSRAARLIVIQSW